MEARLLIAFVLMFLVLFLTPYLYKQVPGPKSAPNITPQKAEQVTKPPVMTPAPTPPPAAPAKAAAAALKPGQKPAAPSVVQASTEQTHVIDTAVYHIVFSNRGAVVKSWVLKKYQDLNGKPLELVNPGSLGKVPAPMSIDFKDRKPDVDVNQALYVAKPTEDGGGIDFEYANGQTTVRKSFHFGKDSYRSEVMSEVSVPGATLPHYLVWRGGFGDPTIHNAPSVERTVYWDNADTRLFTKSASDAKNGPVGVSGAFTFAGIEDSFFTAVVVPGGSGILELRTFSDELPYGDKNERFVGAEIGGAGTNRFPMFVGPKDSDILKAVDPRLDQLIDWGRWFGFLAKPLFYALNWTNDKITHNFGWAIVLVTVAINMLTLPLRLTSMKSAKKMQALQPQIAAINARYKNLGLRDPKQAGEEPGGDGPLQEARREPAGRLPADGAAIPVLLRVLQGADRSHRDARRGMVVGARSLAAGATGHSHPAGDPDRHAVPDAEDDSGIAGDGSHPAENDDVHAAGVRVHVLLSVVRSRTILVDW